MNVTPRNIFDIVGKWLPTQRGGSVCAWLDGVGRWQVKESMPPCPADKSDRGMLPQHYLMTDVDVWAACRMLNEVLCTQEETDNE